MHQSIFEPSSSAPLQVLLVCPRGEYLDSVRDLARHLARETQVLWTANPSEALQQIKQAPPALAIVDARLDRATGSALTRELQHGADAVEVMRFDERRASAAPGDPGVWHWSELPRALAWWARRRPRHQPSL